MIKKETPTQVSTCEYYKIFMNTYFEEHLRTTTSAHLTAQSNNLFGVFLRIKNVRELILVRIHKNNYLEVMVFATCFDSHIPA